MCVKNENILNSFILVTVQVRHLRLCINVQYGSVAYVLRLRASRQRVIRDIPT